MRNLKYELLITSVVDVDGRIKGTNCLKKDMVDFPWLIQLKTLLQVSDYRDFWTDERWKP